MRDKSLQFIGRFSKKAAYELLQLNIFKEVQAAKQLNSSSLSNLILPPKYGKKLPERVIELLLAWITYRPNMKILDVGHAHAMNSHLKLLKSLHEPKVLIGLDASAPIYYPFTYYTESVIGDITRAAFCDESFNLIWCISTLEHIGKDNSEYDSRSLQSGTDIQAVNEMLRILADKGSLLITVPFGKYEDHNWFINYDRKHWQTLLRKIESNAYCEELYFKHTEDAGWAAVSPHELKATGYYDQANAGAAGLAAAYIRKNK